MTQVSASLVPDTGKWFIKSASFETHSVHTHTHTHTHTREMMNVDDPYLSCGSPLETGWRGQGTAFKRMIEP